MYKVTEKVKIIAQETGTLIHYHDGYGECYYLIKKSNKSHMGVSMLELTMRPKMKLRYWPQYTDDSLWSYTRIVKQYRTGQQIDLPFVWKEFRK